MNEGDPMRLVLLIIAMMLTPQAVLAGARACAPPALPQMVGSLAAETNALRAARGHDALRLDGRLSQAAQRHACDIARRAVVTHRDAAGRRPLARVKRAGFRACFTAENVAMGSPDPGRTVQAWQASTGHARNQHDPRARSMGFGVARDADGRLWWVALYASACEKVSRRAGW